ncbi:MAG: DUF2007 domain-containing protein [Betaproteobacteria bacterium]|nr:MAG: DUF2007 domain-containing protein [Betaproteobacteria bacterium]
MRRIYTAETLPDAHLVVGLLAQAGIAAKVFNENAQGGVGEIPFTHTWPEVWLENEDDAERAHEVIRTLERGGTNQQVECRKCGESNPDNFEICWNCGVTIES